MSLVLSADATQLAMALRARSVSMRSKHSAPKVKIEVTVEQVGTCRRRAAAAGRGLSIRDTGPGIPPHVRRHLFDPFYSGREAGRGLGLGLAKCWRVITLHGGRIEVSSQPRQGTTFTLYLPVPVRDAQPEHDSALSNRVKPRDAARCADAR